MNFLNILEIKRDNMDMQDDKIKALLSGTKIKAGENLTYRIMRQIEAEQALVRKKATNSRPVINNMITIFGVMYLLIAIAGLIVYFSAGKEALESMKFFAPVILIASACGIFWSISTFDDRRRSKHKS
ncbi:MAG: hypothetical protein LBN74_09900 [Prevotella sp.]|nr:hypothetical protein [Prevotella sp.]